MNHQAARGRAVSLALSKDSHMISKLKPRIRIVHMFAPEIIKTNVENFPELVQRLTGKPTKRIGGQKPAPPRMMDAPETISTVRGRRELLYQETVKEEPSEEKISELWDQEDISGGFLSGFGDTEGFFQDFSDFT